jgi:DNA (cytosine-5)-methyltransferase 1
VEDRQLMAHRGAGAAVLRGGTLFSGIDAPEVAAPFIDWRWRAEIDPFANAVSRHHRPETLNLGDVSKIDASRVELVDLLVFGSPCQSFSVAGKRLGLDDPRGNLALVALGLARQLRPSWVVFENVLGLLSSDEGRNFGAFLGLLGQCGYGWAYRVLDAQHFGVPQRRRRVFVVGHLGDWRRAAAVLFEPESLQGHPAPRREAGEGIARPIAAGSPSGGGYRNDADTAENLIAFGGNNTAGSIDTATAVNAHGGPHGRLDFESETFIAHSLRADGFDASKGPGAVLASSVRRLTPRECERLQGFPDDFTAVPYRGKPAADGPRYRALGNSMAVPVMRWILERIAIAHGLSLSRVAA